MLCGPVPTSGHGWIEKDGKAGKVSAALISLFQRKVGGARVREVHWISFHLQTSFFGSHLHHHDGVVVAKLGVLCHGIGHGVQGPDLARVLLAKVEVPANVGEDVGEGDRVPHAGPAAEELVAHPVVRGLPAIRPDALLARFLIGPLP